MPPLYNFNPGQKSWKMYANTLTSISGDDLTISPVERQDLILEVSGNDSDIMFKHNNNNVFRIDSATVTISHHTTISGDLDVLGNVDISGKLLLFNTELSGNITTSTLNHNATIKSTSNIYSDKFLKIKINGSDGWIPYFTADPSQ